MMRAKRPNREPGTVAARSLLLAIETSGPRLGVALARRDDGEVLAEVGSRSPLSAALRVLPAIDFLLADLDADKDALGAVAVDVGPGSFTGLRVGLMVAKTLAAEAALPLAAVPSLVARARAHLGGPLEPGWPAVVMADARRGQVYGAIYAAIDDEDARDEDDDNVALAAALGSGERTPSAVADPATDDPWRTLLEPINLPAETFLLRAREALAGRPAVLCCAPALLAALGERAAAIPPGWEYLPGTPLAQLEARHVAAVGFDLLAHGRTADPMTLEPDYVRGADAKLPKVPQPE